jgi:DNA-binding IclR family transcriptional regulator
MSQNPLSDALSPDIASVTKILANQQCRELLRGLDRPMTASELTAVCDIPRSSVYEKLDMLAENGLLRRHERGSEVKYSIDFQEVVVAERNGTLEISIRRSPQSAADQLADLWGNVRAEASSD